MKSAPFAYHAPASLDEALELLGRLGDDAKVLAGGQSLLPMLAMRLSRFDHLIDLRRIESLQGIRRDDGAVRIAAMTRQVTIERSQEVVRAVPLLARATPHIGHFQIRNRGTLGGSLAHADPAAEYPSVARALDAEIEVAGPDGTRTIPTSEFFVSTWMTALEPEEIVVATTFPVWAGRCGFSVLEMARRHGDFAMAGVACGVEVADGRVSRAAIALFGMDSVPVRASDAERAITGSDAPGLDVEAAGAAAVEDLSPPDDIHASSAHRKRIGKALVARALGSAVREAQGG